MFKRTKIEKHSENPISWHYQKKVIMEWKRPSNIWEFLISTCRSVWSPIDLIALARVSKLFYASVKKMFPDYGLKTNMVRYLKDHPHIQKITKKKIEEAKEKKIEEAKEKKIEEAKKNKKISKKITEEEISAIKLDVAVKFYDDTLKYGFYFFGSTLLAALVTRFETCDSPFEIGDLDLFYPAERLDSTCRFNCAVPKVVPYLEAVFDDGFRHFISANSKYDSLDMFTLFKPRENCQIEDCKIEFPVAIIENRKEKNAHDKCAWRHISRSDLPLQRIFLGPNGFRMISLEAFLGDQIGDVSKLKVLNRLPHMINNLRKVGNRKLRTVKLRIPMDDFELVKETIECLTTETTMIAEGVPPNQSLICTYPF